MRLKRAYSAAVIHYKPERGNCPTIDPNAVYLCDSGAQYLDGTTDTTRTLHFGTPTDREIEAYTLVLKGNIALDTAVFPKGTTGLALDCLARQHLWVRTTRDEKCALTNESLATRPGLSTRHGTRRRLLPERPRRPDRYWHQSPVCRSRAGSWKRRVRRAWFLRGRFIRHPY